MTKRKPKEASNAAFDGMTSGHPNLLSGSRLTRDRADLNNGYATQNHVSTGPLFRREGARPGVPEAPCPKKATRKSGVNGLTVAGQARKKIAPKLTRRSGNYGPEQHSKKPPLGPKRDAKLDAARRNGDRFGSACHIDHGIRRHSGRNSANCRSGR